MIELKTTGFKELEDALRRLPQEVAGKTLRSALRKSGQPMADLWAGTAPRSDVATKAGHAADSIKVRANTHESDDDVSVHLAIGPDRGHFYLSFDEFGTVRQPASGVGRRAWDSQEDQILSNFGRDLGAAIERAAKRLAKG